MVSPMPRNSVIVVALLVGCTRPNPAFDDFIASGSDESTSVAEGTSVAEATDQAESGSESGVTDLPGTCDFQPTAGLDLKFGDPSQFGGNCPPTANTWARVIESGGGLATVETCIDPGCVQCGGMHPMSIYPLLVGDYLPGDPPACLKLQASVSLGPAPDICQWGAISLHDALDSTPYVIATAHSSQPTPLGQETLAGSIPEPVEVGNCNCEDIGLGNDCCYQANTPPQFWGYPWGDEVLRPGDYGLLPLANQAGLEHYFKVFQAERIYSCEQPELALSWAVVAVFP